MRTTFLRPLLAFSCLVVAPAARAQVVYDNPRNADAVDAGAFSHPTQMLASRFALSTDATVTGASWFGTMNASDPLNTGDFWAFDVVFRSSVGTTPGAAFAMRSVNASVFETAFSIENQRVYRFDALFSGVDLSASTNYFFSAINTGPAATFRWNQGTVDDGAMFSSNDGTVWNSLGTRAPLAYQLSASPTTTVPEPSSVFLLASALPLLLFVARRRRRAAVARVA